MLWNSVKCTREYQRLSVCSLGGIPLKRDDAPSSAVALLRREAISYFLIYVYSRYRSRLRGMRPQEIRDIVILLIVETQNVAFLQVHTFRSVISTEYDVSFESKNNGFQPALE